MDLDEKITLTDAAGRFIELPLVNLLRITLVKLSPLCMQYLEEDTNPTVRGLFEWLPEKLGLQKGESVLL